MQHTERGTTSHQTQSKSNKSRGRRGHAGRGRYSRVEGLLTGMQRHNLKLLEIATSDRGLVRLPGFHLDGFLDRLSKGLVSMEKRLPQPGLQPLRLCNDAGPRMVVDQDGRFLLFYIPNFWGAKAQAHMTDAINTLDSVHPLQMDKDRKMNDKRAQSGSAQGSRRAEWGLHHHGIGQQHKHTLRPSPSLRTAGGTIAVKAREAYLSEKELNDHKVNHITKLIHPTFHESLVEAKLKISQRSAEGATWVEKWTSNYLNQAIFENRQTPLHRDGRGAHYCMDFLSILGDFTGGDLFLPDLNLKLEWLPNSACTFDGRTFAHEVMPWTGEKRLCLVNYIWKSSLLDLGVSLPVKAPTLSEIMTRVQAERALRKESNTAGIRVD